VHRVGIKSTANEAVAFLEGELRKMGEEGGVPQSKLPFLKSEVNKLLLRVDD
jgi:hypothetical protein